MRFLELALQGVRSFQSKHRFQWDPGFTVMVGGSGSGKSTLVESLLYLLYPDPMSHGTSRFTGADPNQCRGALTMGNGQETYTLVHDLLKGAMVLSRLDPAAGKYAPITASAAEILQFLTSQLHLPQQDIENGLFVLRADRFPSVRPNVVPAASPPPSRPGLAAGVPPRGGSAPAQGPGKGPAPGFQGYRGETYDVQLEGTPEELQAQLVILERDIARAKQLDEWQFQLDGLYHEQAQADEGVQEIDKLTEEAQGLEKELEKSAVLEKLPADFARRLGEQLDSKSKLDKTLARIDEEKQELTRKIERATPLPIWQNQLFQAGMGVGLGALLVGAAGFFLFEMMRYVALLDLVGFAMVTFVGWRHIEELEDVAGLQVKLDSLMERREKAVREHEVEVSVVRTYMEEIKAKDPEMVIDDIKARQELLNKLKGVNDQIAEFKKNPEVVAQIDKQASLRTQIKELEERIANNPPLQMGTMEMEQRAKAIRQRLASPGPEDGDAERSPEEIQVAPDQPVAAAGLARGSDKDLCQDLLRFADDQLHLGKEQLERMIANRASQYLAALSANTFPRIHFLEGEMTGVTEQATNGTLPFTRLSPATQDLVYLGVQLALIEACVRKSPVPVLLDDPFQTISPNLFELIGRMLAGLSKVTQVILLTSQPAWSRYATKAFKLG